MNFYWGLAIAVLWGMQTHYISDGVSMIDCGSLSEAESLYKTVSAWSVYRRSGFTFVHFRNVFWGQKILKTAIWRASHVHALTASKLKHVLCQMQITQTSFSRRINIIMKRFIRQHHEQSGFLCIIDRNRVMITHTLLIHPWNAFHIFCALNKRVTYAMANE